jgi:hypothetical protein
VGAGALPDAVRAYTSQERSWRSVWPARPDAEEEPDA